MPKLGCKNCGNCTWLDGFGAVEQVCVDCEFDENGHPTNWRPRKPMTNADRIRSMSDEELAGWLCSMFECRIGKCPACDMCSAGDNGLIKWLQKPWEEK